MNWLVTIRPGTDLDLLKELLDQWGCEFTDLAPITLDQVQVVEVEGPPNLPELISDEKLILEIHPNSTMKYF